MSVASSVIIDCDPGLDDAVAIALAVVSPGLCVEAITTVAGNAPIDVMTRNALGVCEALGVEVPVYQGAGRPLVVEPCYSTMLWGGDGSLGLRAPVGAARGAAVDHLAGAFARSPILCAVGPLTNLACLFRDHPTAVLSRAPLVVMGGALGPGNASPHAELNIWFDPHAAARVFGADAPITLVPLDVTRQVKVRPEHVRALSRATSPAARLCARLLPLAGADSHPSSIHDACAVGWLLWPELFELEEGEVTVVLEGDEIGRTRFEPGRGGRHRVATGLDVEAFLERLVAALCGVGG